MEAMAMVNVGKDGEEVRTVLVKCLSLFVTLFGIIPQAGLALIVDLPPINMNISSFTLAAKKAQSLTQRR